MEVLEQKDRDIRVYEEFSRIFKYFEGLSENEKELISPLVQNAAFMRIALDDLQEIITKEGPVESYQNGANQSGMKQSAALQAYNALVKNYAAVIKRLTDMLPPMRQNTVSFAPVIRDPAEMKRQQEEHDRNTREELARAAAFQQKQRELDDLISKAGSMEERQRLIRERNSLRYSSFTYNETDEQGDNEE